MKPLAAIVCLFFSATLFAQSSFEGTIIYSARASGEKDTIELLIDFGVNGIKITPIEPRRDKEVKEYILISFDSGKVFTINNLRKTFTSHKLSEKLPVNEVPPIKTIAGHLAIGQLYNESGVSHIFGSLLSNRTIFYTAENLNYSIPEKYEGNYELMMVQKDKVVLGAEIYIMPNFLGFGGRRSDEDSAGKLTIFIEAKEVVSKKFEAAEFRIPDGFTKNKPYSYHYDEMALDSMRMVDSISVMTAPEVDFGDTTTAVKTEKPVIKKKTRQSPSRHKSATKQKATLRKDE